MTPTSPAVRQDPHIDHPDESDPGHEPFEAAADKEFYYEEAIQEKRLKLLLHLAPYSEVLLITGEQGAGKTCLLDRFVARAGEGWRICRLSATVDMSPDNLLADLDEAFSLNVRAPDEDRETLVRRMREAMHALRRSALVPLLIVDDAHNLSLSAMTLLAALTEPAEGDEKLLGAILVGQPEINDMLAAPELEEFSSRVSHSFDLPPMSEQDTERYIRHRLSAAGMDADRPFTPSVVKFIHVASRGLPGRINELAREVLRNSQQQTGSDGGSGKHKTGGAWRYGLAAALVAALALGLIYQDQWTGPAESPGGGAPQPGQETRPAPAFEPPAAREGAATPSPLPPLARSTPEPLDPDDIEEVAPPATEPEGIAAAEGPATEGEAAGAEANSETPAETPQDRMEETAEGPPPVGEGAAAPASSPAPDMATTAAEEGGEAAPEGPKGEAWLRAQDPAAYTVQLLAMAEPKVTSFLKQHDLEDEVAVYRTGSGGAGLLAVTYGLFESRVEAVRAGEQLADGLGGAVSPWVRTVASIHDTMASDSGETPAPPRQTPAPAAAAKGKDWLMAREGARYTLQLLAMPNEKAIAFVDRHGIAGEVAVYRTRSGNRELTAVTYGVYEDRAAAERAAAEVASRLGVTPWPRPFRAVQAAISAQQAEDGAGL